MNRVVASVVALAAVIAGGAAGAPPASAGGVPSWTLQLRVSRWVAPSAFSATVTGQTDGLEVRVGLPVTLRLDRRTRCSTRDAGVVVTRVPCAGLRPAVARDGTLAVTASGQFETGHLGAIGFRARTVVEQL